MSVKDKNRKYGLIVSGIGIALLLIVGLYQHYLLKPTQIENKIQRSILQMDKEMQYLIEQGINKMDFDKTNTGLFLFNNDSLVYWNRNDIYPRNLRRKILIGHDTICTLPSGDYYIKSFEKDNQICYVFKLINTHYTIENQYFKNNCKGLPRFVEAKVRFAPENEGFPIINQEGKILSHCKILEKPTIKSPYKYWYIVIGAVIIIGLLIAFKPTRRQKKSNKTSYSVEIGISVILLLSVIATYTYNKRGIRKENQNMAMLAEQLKEKRDMEFEKSYAAFSNKLEADTNIREMLFDESNVLADVLLGYTKELVFDEVMKSYTVTLTICDPDNVITLEPDGYTINCEEYFLGKKDEYESKNVGKNLYFIDDYTLDPNYLGYMSFLSTDSLRTKTLYFEFYKPVVPEGFGFPQLLQDNNSEKPYEYSMANYRDNILVYKYGKYIYPNFLNEQQGKDHEFNLTEGFKHYTIQYGEGNALIISTEKKGWTAIMAPFAVFFLGMSIPYLLLLWLLSPKDNQRRYNLRHRLQRIILSTLGLSFVVIGPISVIFMRSIYHQKTKEAQFETTRTIAFEMKNDLDLTDLMENASKDTWAEVLQHFANTFFTDLNLYQTDGRLIASTRQELFENHLQAPVMNAEAYQNIHKNKALYYTHQEMLGNGKYESAYIPLTDHFGNTLAYLNTPYFSSETDLQKEIWNFVLTYINVILILLGVALILIMAVMRRLTKPLTLIQNKLGDIKIDQKNERIEWNSKDEIGALIKQYNKLIVELEKSAEELKRTTAESAWRGVARQVAHEIKNSLTPMRLSVQMLQQSMKNGSDDLPERVQRTTFTLIEQIDALSEIASSFSTYAKLPESHPQPFDLAELVENLVNLYDNTENITFLFDYDKTLDHTFNGDKTNLNSAIGNIIKNAVQAIGNKADGHIEVRLVNTEEQYVISVRDNGKGIKEEDKKQIFTPNFTTKSGGSGIGLSLAYNIVQAAGGSIRFESEEGLGTVFYIELKK